ncbi:jg20117 [Pararge aegeria aegeria]|uniref:Jg20117 protein n=1 Tax=Pararge aegeria aegeria TaxID=348720 RepID=A0A8S4R009_9NEOP|nr:jg20117 [Pararge aegeria aegeria]
MVGFGGSANIADAERTFILWTIKSLPINESDPYSSISLEGGNDDQSIIFRTSLIQEEYLKDKCWERRKQPKKCMEVNIAKMTKKISTSLRLPGRKACGPGSEKIYETCWPTLGTHP